MSVPECKKKDVRKGGEGCGKGGEGRGPAAVVRRLGGDSVDQGWSGNSTNGRFVHRRGVEGVSPSNRGLLWRSYSLASL